MRLRAVILPVMLAALACESCLAGSTLFSWAGSCQLAKCAYSRASYDMATSGVVYDKSVAAWDGEEAGVGVVETPEVVARKPFTEVVPSWNATTPAGAYVIVLAKVRIDGAWTRWYKMELYNVAGKPELKKSFGDGDETIKCPNDTLEIRGGKRADAVKLRFELRSTDGVTYPTLRFLAVNTNDPDGWQEGMSSVKDAWGKELDVPYLCQLSVNGGSVWCSPTSTAMVLGYWSKLLERPEMTVGITEAARACKDNRWGGTGHWSFNTAYAGEFEGMRGFVDRFSSISRIEWWIARGVPVIVSLDYNRLNRRSTKDSMGHLMVIRGFTKDGDPVFNDPWARLEKGEQLRKVYKRADLEYAWLGPEGSYGTVYVIYPESKGLSICQ